MGLKNFFTAIAGTSVLPFAFTKSLQFDGVDSVITFENDMPLNGINKVVLTFWGNIPTTGKLFIGAFNAGNDRFEAQMTSNILYGIVRGGSGSNSATVTGYSNYNTLNHYCMIYDGSKNQVKLFENNILIGVDSIAPAILTANLDDKFTIGIREDGLGSITNGKICNVGLMFENSFQNEQVAELNNNGNGQFVDRVADFNHIYLFDEESSSTSLSDTGSATTNNGILTGFPGSHFADETSNVPTTAPTVTDYSSLSGLNINLITFGNSLTASITGHLPNEIKRQLEYHVNSVTLVNSGVGGATIDDMIASYSTSVRDNLSGTKTNVVIINEDVNGIYEDGLTGEQNMSKVNEILNLCVDDAVEVVGTWNTYYPRTTYPANYDAPARAEQQDYFDRVDGDELVGSDFNFDGRTLPTVGGAADQSTADDPAYFSDHVHLYAVGYEEAGKGIAIETLDYLLTFI